jgi:hypothetical protein
MAISRANTQAIEICSALMRRGMCCCTAFIWAIACKGVKYITPIGKGVRRHWLISNWPTTHLLHCWRVAASRASNFDNEHIPDRRCDLAHDRPARYSSHAWSERRRGTSGLHLTFSVPPFVVYHFAGVIADAKRVFPLWLSLCFIHVCPLLHSPAARAPASNGFQVLRAARIKTP